MAQREAVAHLGIQVEQALFECDHAGRRDERLGQRGEGEQRVRPCELVAAALADARVALGEHAALVHDDGRDPRHQAVRHPIVDPGERFLHTGHRSGWCRFRDIC